MGPPADAVAVPSRYGKLFPDRALLERAAAGREAVDRGADPALVLSLVVWPTEAVVAASFPLLVGEDDASAVDDVGRRQTPPPPSAPTGRSRTRRS